MKRDGNLDLLRALAITTVVFCHLVLLSPVPLAGLTRFAQLGKYGVDLFLSSAGG
jgi:peptidoglycan/LPS O-acetylase OafA/YrhL